MYFLAVPSFKLLQIEDKEIESGWFDGGEVVRIANLDAASLEMAFEGA